MARNVILQCGTAVMFGLDSVFYHPSREPYDDPRNYDLKYEPVSFRTRDNLTLDGWFFPAVQNPAAGTVIQFHGNAGNITRHFQHVGWLPAAGWNVLCFDYRGYGRSEGKPSRAGLVTDCHAAIDYTMTRNDIDPQRVVIFGQSLGGALGIVTAAERKNIAGLAVEGAFSHYRRIASWHIRRSLLLRFIAWWVPGFSMTDDLNPIDSVARIAPTPLLFIHGKLDEIVPVEMAEELHAAAGNPKELWILDKMGHYGALNEMAEQARPKLLHFIQTCVERKQQAS